MLRMLALVWTLVLLVLGPISGFASRGALTRRTPRRFVAYGANAANLVVIGGITAAIDIARGGAAIRTLTLRLSPGQLLAWTLGVSLSGIVLTLVVFWLRVRLQRLPSSFVMALLPETTTERAVFLALCVLVGVAEEFMFRGFALATLTAIVGPAAAVTLVTVDFASMHGVQDGIAIARALVLGALLVVPVIVTGSLVPSIVAHAVIDAFAGLWMRPLLPPDAWSAAARAA